jgi:hypothetical protein
MNIKFIYFILFLVFGSYLISVENLDVDLVISEKMKKIKNKMGSNKLYNNDEINPALQDGYNTDINSLASKKVQDSLGKYNTINISSDEDKIENKVIENKPIITSNNEKGGGITNVIIILGLVLVALYLINK